MKKLLLVALLWALPTCAQVAYVQTNYPCQLLGCGGAQFAPAATLSYSITGCRVMGCKFQNSTVVWKDATYNDFTGQMLWLGYGNHYPFGTWRVQGTFNGGASFLTEDFECFRTCGTRSNVSGTVNAP